MLHRVQRALVLLLTALAVSVLSPCTDCFAEVTQNNAHDCCPGESDSKKESGEPVCVACALPVSVEKASSSCKFENEPLVDSQPNYDGLISFAVRPGVNLGSKFMLAVPRASIESCTLDLYVKHCRFLI